MFFVFVNFSCYFCERNPREIYVLEDLNDAEYRSMNRYVGLDLEETKVVLKKLAIFHAASMKYIEKVSAECREQRSVSLRNIHGHSRSLKLCS